MKFLKDIGSRLKISYIERAFLYGFLLWLLPFFVSMLLTNWHDYNRNLFNSVMAVVETGAALFFAIIYLKRVNAKFFPESIRLGVIWFIISFVINLVMYMQGTMKLSFKDYIEQYGITYLIIPMVTIGIGYLLGKIYQEI